MLLTHPLLSLWPCPQQSLVPLLALTPFSWQNNVIITSLFLSMCIARRPLDTNPTPAPGFAYSPPHHAHTGLRGRRCVSPLTSTCRPRLRGRAGRFPHVLPSIPSAPSPPPPHFPPLSPPRSCLPTLLVGAPPPMSTLAQVIVHTRLSEAEWGYAPVAAGEATAALASQR